jgi:hypothetical protein
MEEENDSYKLWQLYQIANTLFWINLLPALVACCAGSFFLITSLNQPEGLILPISLIPGLYCEWIYYKQRSDQEYLTRRFGWVYSIVLNTICIIFFIGCLFGSDVRIMAVLGIYPLGFLITSCIALSIKIKLK